MFKHLECVIGRYVALYKTIYYYSKLKNEHEELDEEKGTQNKMARTTFRACCKSLGQARESDL